jgi:IclR family pca regulon transcriptional regulator
MEAIAAFPQNIPTHVTAPEPQKKEVVASFVAGLQVLRSFSAHRPIMNLSAVSEESGLTRAAARRYLMTLCDQGYANFDGKNYSLTSKVLELGFTYISSLGLTEVATPVLRRVSADLDHTCSLAVLDDADIVFVGRAAGHKISNVQLNIGTRAPAFATSLGRVLLSDLELGKLERLLREYPRRPLTDQTIWDVAGLTSAITDARERGFCLLREEFERGICSLAVPIQNSTGQVVAAMNVCCHTWQKSAEQMETEFLPAMRQAAAEISGSLT